jgi:protein phosphatase
MSEPKVYFASVTDRGLNERRPLNEDSFLDDGERHIFAVADGVGGSEAGEVASQTAIEVLDEAFRHQVDGADIEDLMELAMQRANASIHRMSYEHENFSMMATTVVALHLNGNIVTIGHVGDSRIYRLTPAGSLIRETEDHSIVEEEVRAGRMTAEQAANHPSKNVISRALGAEESVEVDLKTMEVENGTCFLLCSDGITRHIPDHELEVMLTADDDLAAVCEELKRRCYERGAEDNLTAVIVRLGEPLLERQQLRSRRALSLEHPRPVEAAVATKSLGQLADRVDLAEDGLAPPSRIVVFGASTGKAQPEGPLNIRDSPSSGGGGFARFFVLLLFVAAVAAAFYGGTRYQGPLPFGLTRPAEAIPVSQPSPSPEELFLKFEKARREVDQAPAEWLNTAVPKQLTREHVGKPLDSTEPEFLYLYGRASLLSSDSEEAAKSFEKAIGAADTLHTVENATIRNEAVLALAAVTLKSHAGQQRARTHLNALAPTATPVKPTN